MSAAIVLERMTKRFGAKVAVQGVSLTVPLGAVFGLIGPNGAGKTTTFGVVSGYLTPSDGRAEVLGYAPQRVDVLRGRLGVLPQDALLPRQEKVCDFLMYLARIQGMTGGEAHRAARLALEEVGGAEWWPQRCGNLSHGMAKRVSIAQALLGEPEVVLLDEPTAGLDPKVAHEVRTMIRRRRGQMTIVISSHNLHELEELCDHAAILDSGTLVTTGTMAELTAKAEEVHVEIAPGPVPIAEVRRLDLVSRVEWHEDRRDLIVSFDRKAADAETVIAAVLSVLLRENARISGVTKGRGLEKRVMDLTAAGRS